jgi:hypothetical protein
MKSVQYEELCRHFLAEKLDLPVERIISDRILNPKRGDFPQYKHQIDLYWETEDGVSRYLNIANAKWRRAAKVDQPAVLLLQQVKQEVSAHKAIMFTNSGFTSGAKAAAQDKGIALYVVQPAFDASVLHAKDRGLIQQKIQELAASSSEPLVHHEVVYKAFELTGSTSSSFLPSQAVAPSYSKKVVIGSTNKAFIDYSHKGGSAGGGQVDGTRGGLFTKGGGGFRTK